MANSRSTSEVIRNEIIHLWKLGFKYWEIGNMLGLSEVCIKKRIQAYRRYGKDSLIPKSCRPKKEPPHQTSRKIRAMILRIKREHPTWGGQFIIGELKRRGVEKPPHRHTIENILSHYPTLAPKGKKARRNFKLGRRATGFNEVWQIDYKDSNSMPDGNPRQILNIRDNGSTITIALSPLAPNRTVPTMQETIDLLRKAFAENGVLPVRCRTDHGTCFVGNCPDPFPSRFTLYLWGMGIEHQLISPRRPQQNGGVERSNRTLDEHLLVELKDKNVCDDDLPAILNDYKDFQNNFVPSRSVACKNKTPVEALVDHPNVGKPFNIQLEKQMFSMENIYKNLSTYRWKRKVDAKAEVELGDVSYYLGVKWKFLDVEITFDPIAKELVFKSIIQNLVKRIPPKNLTYEYIIGGDTSYIDI